MSEKKDNNNKIIFEISKKQVMLICVLHPLFILLLCMYTNFRDFIPNWGQGSFVSQAGFLLLVYLPGVLSLFSAREFSKVKKIILLIIYSATVLPAMSILMFVLVCFFGMGSFGCDI